MGSSASSVVRSMPSDLSEASDAQLQLIIDKAILTNVLTWFNEAELRQLHDRHVELQENKPKSLDKDDAVLLLDQKYNFDDFAVQMIMREARKMSLRPIAPHEYRSLVKRQSSNIKVWVADNTFRDKEDEFSSVEAHINLPLSREELVQSVQ